MAILTRVNPKTHNIEYRVRYLWKDANGKRRDSKTGWFLTVEEAVDKAEELKLRRNLDSVSEYESRKDQKVIDVFSSWVYELEAKSERATTENTTSDSANKIYSDLVLHPKMNQEYIEEARYSRMYEHSISFLQTLSGIQKR